MKTGQSKNRLHERLRRKMTENADLQLDSLATQVESFTTDIKERVASGLSTINSDIDQYTNGMHRRLESLTQQTDIWTEKTEKAARIMQSVRLGWLRDGLFTLIAPMMIGALASGIVGALVTTVMISKPSSPPISPPPRVMVETTTGLGGLGKVLRHPAGSEVVPCPLRSASGSVCVKLPKERR